MTDFQVGDRVSVEGVVSGIEWVDFDNAPEYVGVDLPGLGETTFRVDQITLVERPRRKLRVGSVWDRTGGAMSPNAGLTDEQKERNRLRWLLTEAAARTSTPVTVGIVDAMAKAIREIMQENQLVLAWLSAFERDAASDDPS